MKFKISPLLALLLCSPILANMTHMAMAAGNISDHTRQIIVKFKSTGKAGQGPSPAIMHSLQADTKRPLQFKRHSSNNTQVFSLDKPLPLDQVKTMAQQLMQRDDIEYAEPDVRRYPQAATNDTDYTNQWYLFESAGGIAAEEAWDITNGDSNTVIAVLDTGILPHSDISRVLTGSGYDFISEDSPGVFNTANDTDGRDNDPADPGDAVSAMESLAPGGPFQGCPSGNSSWHGTIITGMLVADTNDNAGIAGLDHNASVLPVRVLGKCGGFVSDIADAIRWSVGLNIGGVPVNSNPADVINLSFGSTGSCSISEQLAIQAAVATGAVVVAATGNEGDTAITAPANCDNVIAVAATTRQGGETCYTNVSEQVDISAPGGNSNEASLGCSSALADGIYSTNNSGSTTPVAESLDYAVGTSFSTPLVSGAAALLKSINSGFSAANIEGLLLHTARAFPNGTTDSFRDCSIQSCGLGILDINAAVSLAPSVGTDSSVISFNFNSVTGAEIDTQATSVTRTISGIDVPVVISIVNGEYSIDGATFTSLKGTMTNGQTVAVRTTSAASLSTSTSSTLTVAGFSTDFTVTTMSPPSSGGGGGSPSREFLLLILFAMICKTSLKRIRQPGHYAKAKQHHNTLA